MSGPHSSSTGKSVAVFRRQYLSMQGALPRRTVAQQALCNTNFRHCKTQDSRWQWLSRCFNLSLGFTCVRSSFVQSYGIVSGHSCHRPGRASRLRPVRGPNLAVSTSAYSRLVPGPLPRIPTIPWHRRVSKPLQPQQRKPSDATAATVCGTTFQATCDYRIVPCLSCRFE